MIKRKTPETPVPAPSGPFAGIPDLPATHDAMFKVLAKAYAAALLRAYLPKRYRELVDFGTVLQLEGYRLKVLRFYAEGGKGTDRQGKRGGRGKRRSKPQPPLPLFIPLVFYHGSQEWNAPTSLREMFRHQDAAGPEMDGLQCILIDLGKVPLEALADEPEPWAVQAAMRFATRGREGEPYLAEIYKALAGKEMLQRQVEHYIISNWAGITEEALMVARAAADRETGGERTMQTLAEKWTNEGRAEGMAQGMAGVVLSQLRHRFNGRVSEQDESRVARASVEELGLWAERLLTADSPEEVFAPPQSQRH